MTEHGCLPGEQNAAKGILERHSKLFSQGEDLLRLAFSFPRDISMRRNEVQFFQAVIALCAKSIKTFRGVHLLCSRGLCEDALAMSRTLIEILTSIKHLNTGDRRANARQFWEFTALKADGLVRLFDGVPNADPHPPDSADQFRRFVGDIRSRMNKEELKKWMRSSWHRKGIVPLASTLGLPSLERPYRFACSAVHATDVFDHLDVRTDGGFVMKCLPGDKWARLVLLTSNLLFLGILKEVDTACGFGLDPELMRIFSELVPEAGPVD